MAERLGSALQKLLHRFESGPDLLKNPNLYLGFFIIFPFKKLNIMAHQTYINQVAEDKKAAFEKLYTTVKNAIPKGFEDSDLYNMVSFVVPLSTYPSGYHCTPNTPLPFISLAAQKNFISLYHMGVYADNILYQWFINEYPKHCKKKLDMGKSCIRFKKMEDIPFELIAELVAKMSVSQWINLYEVNYKK